MKWAAFAQLSETLEYLKRLRCVVQRSGKEGGGSERRKAKGKTRKETRKEEGHLERKPLEGDTLKLT